MNRPRIRFVLPLLALWACGPRAGTGPEGGGGGKPDGGKPGADISDILRRSDLPEPMPSPLPDDPMAVTIHRLANGLTVYISTDREKPRVTGWIAVRAGSRHDPATSTGLAHYLEHMLFKGSDRLGTTDFAKERPHLDRIAQLYKDLRAETDDAKRAAILGKIDAETQASGRYAIPNEFDQLYAGLGAEGINAFTSDETTVYIVDFPSNRFDAWAQIEAEQLAAPQFRLFYPELEAVYEEKNRTLDDPASRVAEAMALALFPQHPYGTQPGIGLGEHLKNPAYQDMVDFFHTWYVPNNMAILLAGDIDAARALPVLEKAFARMKPRAVPATLPGKVAPLTGRNQVVVKAEGEQAVTMAWLTAPANHADELALEVMDLMVDNSTSGLLNVDLVLTQKLPRGGSYAGVEREAGYWVIWGTARDGQSLDEVEKLLAGVVDKLKNGEFTQADIDAVVVNAEIEDKRGLESNDARVFHMMEAYINRTPWPVASQRTARLRKVTRDDVIRVANKYLGPNLVVARREAGSFEPPKMTKPKITPIALDTARQSDFAKRIRALEAPQIEPAWLVEGTDYTRHKLPAGPMIAAVNKRNDLFQLTYTFELGSKRQRLLCHALELMQRSGAGDLTAPALAKKLFAMGTTIDSSCDAETTTLTVTGLDRELEASVALLDRWLRTAKFTADDVAKLAANRISQRKDLLEEPQFVTSALHSYALYGADSDYLNDPSNREVKAAKGAQLAALLARLPDHQHRTVYFGPRAGDQAAGAIALGKKHKKVAPRDPVRYRKAKTAAVFVTDKKVAQAQIRFAVPRAPLENDRRLLARLYSEYVGGGMGALVFQEIREARGLAYRAGAGYDENERPVDQSALIGNVGTQADKTLDATEAMLTLLRKIEIQPARFQVARNSLEQQFRASRVDPRWVGATVFGWLDMGFSADPRPAQWDQLAKVDVAALQAFARDAATGPLVFGIVVDTSRVDLEKLGAEVGAKPQKVAMPKLVSW